MQNAIETKPGQIAQFGPTRAFIDLLLHIRGGLSVCYLGINTLFWGTFLFSITFFRLILPLHPFQILCSRAAALIAECWIFFNNLGLIYTRKINIETSGLENLKRDDWYLIISNHQTWIDIPILQKVFFRKIPFLKFFLKKELIWVPILGPAWWALDFPFMKRYTKKELKKKPHLKGKDMEITKKACEKFRHIPVSVMNFTEGTRFTEEKHQRQNSPFKKLLRPKAGGIGFVMSAMGQQLHYILDVTIIYPQGRQSFWAFLCGRVNQIKVNIRKIPITEEILGDYTTDKAFRSRFQKWLNTLWEEKDRLLSQG